MYHIEFAKKEDIPALTGFFKSVYGSGHITTNEKYLDWQYHGAPRNKHIPEYSNLLLKSDTAIVGHLGLIPYTLIANGKKKNGAYCASLIADRSLRSYGAGALLIREAEKYFDILYTSRANVLAQPALLYSNWSKEFFMTRWIYDYSKEMSTHNTNESNIVEITRFDDVWDSSWKNLQKEYNVTIDRMSEYLNWRFVRAFNTKYVIFGYLDTLFEGYVVLRVEEGNEFKACRIVDFVANEKSSQSLLHKAISFGMEIEANFVDFFAFFDKFKLEFGVAGFYKYDKDIKVDPPMFILPTSRKRLTSNVFYKSVSGASFTPEDWYITKADGDGDRPFYC